MKNYQCNAISDKRHSRLGSPLAAAIFLIALFLTIDLGTSIAQSSRPGGSSTTTGFGNSIIGTPIPLTEFKRWNIKGDYVAAGIGMRNVGSGQITITIPQGSKIVNAYLYWAIISDGSALPANSGLLNGSSLTRTHLGSTGSPCWPDEKPSKATNSPYHIDAFRADVTTIAKNKINSNGVWVATLTAFPSLLIDATFPRNLYSPNPVDATSAFPLLEGASLVVIYSNSKYDCYSTIVINNGAITFDKELVATSFGSFKTSGKCGGKNNGFGNGDQDPPGNSGGHNNAENSDHQDPSHHHRGYQHNGNHDNDDNCDEDDGKPLDSKTAKTTFIVADGQLVWSGDQAGLYNGNIASIVQTTSNPNFDIFSGPTSNPSDKPVDAFDGADGRALYDLDGLWDTHTIDISGEFTPHVATIVNPAIRADLVGSDCLTWVAQVLAVRGTKINGECDDEDDDDEDDEDDDDDDCGNGHHHSKLGGANDINGIAGFALSNNYPNPFTSSTTIEYSLIDQANTRLAVYDILGREVKVLVDKTQDAGSYFTKWNGTDRNGSFVAKGVYLLKLTSGNLTSTKTVMLSR